MVLKEVLSFSRPGDLRELVGEEVTDARLLHDRLWNHGGSGVPRHDGRLARSLPWSLVWIRHWRTVAVSHRSRIRPAGCATAGRWERNCLRRAVISLSSQLRHRLDHDVGAPGRMPLEAVAIGKIAGYVFPSMNSLELDRVSGHPVYLPISQSAWG